MPVSVVVDSHYSPQPLPRYLLGDGAGHFTVTAQPALTGVFGDVFGILFGIEGIFA